MTCAKPIAPTTHKHSAVFRECSTPSPLPPPSSPLRGSKSSNTPLPLRSQTVKSSHGAVVDDVDDSGHRCSCGSSSRLSHYESLPVPCRQEILNFLDPSDLSSMALVSRDSHTDCYREGTIPRIEPVYELVVPEPSTSSDDGRKHQSGAAVFKSLLQKLLSHQTRQTERFARYPSVKIRNIDRCYWYDEDCDRNTDQRQQQQQQQHFKNINKNKNQGNHQQHARILSVVQKLTNEDDRQTHWKSLDLSLPQPKVLPDATVLLGVVVLFPHLTSLDLSNLCFLHQNHRNTTSTATTTSSSSPSATINLRKHRHFSELFGDLPSLERLIWKRSIGVYLMGWHFPSPYRVSTNASANVTNNDNNNNPNYNLRELVLDDAIFDARSPRWISAVSDPEGRYAIFHSCCGDGLEGVSIRNARYSYFAKRSRSTAAAAAATTSGNYYNHDHNHNYNYRRRHPSASLSSGVTAVASNAAVADAVAVAEDTEPNQRHVNHNDDGTNACAGDAPSASMLVPTERENENECDPPSCWPIPQTALVKFVRTAPESLKWFRSDLSPENMEMLRAERPGIELSN